MPTNARENPLVIPVLGLLVESPQHVYQMTATLVNERGVDTTRASVRSLIGVLERAGWVETLRVEKEGNRPERTVYRITSAGRHALASRVEEEIRHPDRSLTPFISALAYLGSLSPTTAIAAMQERIANQKTRLAHLETRYRAARQGAGVSRLHLIETEFAMTAIQHEVNWLSSIIEEAESGTLAWPTPET